MHRPTLLLTDPNSPPTPRRSSILQISSPVTTEIGLALTQYTTQVLLPSNPPPGTEPKSGGGFCLNAKEVLIRRSINLCSYCGSNDHLLPACPLSKHSLFVNKTSTLTLLSLIDTSNSPTVLVTIHEPLGKIKVLALLDTGTDANFIEEKLAKLIGLSASRSLDVKVGNSTIISDTPILQPVTIDLESSLFRGT
ncbi:hypothetical protein DSO57_1005625 [Entomophthora muscae]|uniref:Uncharacterized protein n=1 Tax=Entomophthora muscae TaxID=34485 RepID=A0ACC2S9Q6_9FUNG|nr:hypothetical protein DSO57_1005625 [Entomophthora muscae]